MKIKSWGKCVFAFCLALFFFLAVPSYAHGAEAEEIVKTYDVMLLSVFALLVLAGVAYLGRQRMGEKEKLILFSLTTIAVLAGTAFIVGSTVLLNLSSESGGPVHWHADFEIWACGEKIDLKDPVGLENRIGTSVFHEHGDFRIHVEGTLLKKKEASLHNFFDVTGGSLSRNKIIIPSIGGLLEYSSGDSCGGNEGLLQVFVYRTENGRYHQEKLADFENYVLSPYSNVPPGDCIIIEFGAEKETTEHLCVSYEAVVQRGDIHPSDAH